MKIDGDANRSRQMALRCTIIIFYASFHSIITRQHWRPVSTRRRVRVLPTPPSSSLLPRDALSSPDDLHLHSRSPCAHVLSPRATGDPFAVPPSIVRRVLLICVYIYIVSLYKYVYTICVLTLPPPSSRCNSKAVAAWYTHTHRRARARRTLTHHRRLPTVEWRVVALRSQSRTRSRITVVVRCVVLYSSSSSSLPRRYYFYFLFS